MTEGADPLETADKAVLRDWREVLTWAFDSMLLLLWLWMYVDGAIDTGVAYAPSDPSCDRECGFVFPWWRAMGKGVTRGELGIGPERFCNGPAPSTLSPPPARELEVAVVLTLLGEATWVVCS